MKVKDTPNPRITSLGNIPYGGVFMLNDVAYMVVNTPLNNDMYGEHVGAVCLCDGRLEVKKLNLSVELLPDAIVLIHGEGR